MDINKGPYWGVFHTHPVSRANPPNEDIKCASQRRGECILLYSDVYAGLNIWIRPNNFHTFEKFKVCVRY
jgi:proteasome lid subunit RPN8/RPN11